MSVKEKLSIIEQLVKETEPGFNSFLNTIRYIAIQSRLLIREMNDAYPSLQSKISCLIKELVAKVKEGEQSKRDEAIEILKEEGVLEYVVEHVVGHEFFVPVPDPVGTGRD